MEFIFFDKDDNILFRRSDAIFAHFVHEELKHTATFPDDNHKLIQRGMRVGWLDRNKDLLMFEIRLPVRSLPGGTVAYTAEHICISELRDHIVGDKRAYNVTASSALSDALDGSIWKVGRVEVNPVGSGNFYWINAWDSSVKVRDVWNVRICPRLTFDGVQITGRYLDILSAGGAFHGVRLQLDRNVEQAGVTYDDRELVTALYGRGKGEVVGTNADGEETYGRKIMFGDVVWSKSAGNPADKPSGQLYIEDKEATALYGRRGLPRFGVVEFDDCEDKEELLELTWAELQRRIVPKVSINMTVLNLRSVGYEDQGLDLGDLANVIIDPLHLRTQAKVVQLDEDLLCPENTRPVIGDTIQNVIDKGILTNDAASTGQKIAQAAPSLLQGYIDTAVTGIMSSKTRRQTLPDGSEMYVTEDGNKAVRFTGAGILLADSKDATGDFIWRTAITGDGVVADEITTGVLNANLVRFLGTGTSLDGTTLTIKNPEISPNASVTIGLEGFKMLDGVDVIGGFYKLNGLIRSAVQMLYNPAQKVFDAQIGQMASVGESAVGIELNWNRDRAGFIGPYTADGNSAAGNVLAANNVLMLLSMIGNVDIRANEGDIVFTFMGQNASGQTKELSFTAQNVWNVLAAAGEFS